MQRSSLEGQRSRPCSKKETVPSLSRGWVLAAWMVTNENPERQPIIGDPLRTPSFLGWDFFLQRHARACMGEESDSSELGLALQLQCCGDDDSQREFLISSRPSRQHSIIPADPFTCPFRPYSRCQLTFMYCTCESRLATVHTIGRNRCNIDVIRLIDPYSTWAVL